jgi:hypothetical protein
MHSVTVVSIFGAGAKSAKVYFTPDTVRVSAPREQDMIRSAAVITAWYKTWPSPVPKTIGDGVTSANACFLLGTVLANVLPVLATITPVVETTTSLLLDREALGPN